MRHTKRLALLGAIVTTLGLLLAMAAIVYNASYKEVKAEQEAKLAILLSAKASTVQEKLNELASDILFLQRVPPIQGIIRSSQNQGLDPTDGSTLVLWKSRLESIFISYLESNELAYQARYVGIANDGLELVRVQKNVSGVEVVHEAQLQKKSMRGYFKEIIQQNFKGVYYSDISLNREYGKVEVPYTPTLRIALPVSAPDSSQFGFVMLNVAIAPLFEQLKEELDPLYGLYVLNQNDDFIVHPDRDLTFRFEFGESYQWKDAFRKSASEGVFYQMDNASSEVLVGNQRIDLIEQLRSISLDLSYPMAEIEKSAIQKTLRSLLVVLLVLAILLFYYLQFRRSLKQKDLLSKERARSSAILDGSQDAIIGFSDTGRIVDWNQGASSMFGLVKEEAAGLNLFSLLENVDIESGFQLIEQLKVGDNIKPFESTVRTKQGESLDVSVSLSVVSEEGESQILSFSAIIRDNSQQKSAERKVIELNESLEEKIKKRTEELSRKNAFQTAVMTNAASAIIATDTEGVITTFNPAAQLMLGYEENEVVGSQSPAIFHFAPEVVKRAAEFSEELDRHIEPGFEVFTCKSDAGLKNVHDWTYVRKDGTKLPVNLSISSLIDDQGAVIGYLGIATDISEHLHNRKQIEKVKEQLTKASEVAQLGVWTWNAVTSELVWNDRMYEIYERDKSQNKRLAYEDWADALVPEERSAVEKLLSDALESDAPFDTIFKINTPSGKIKHIKAGAQIERDEKGRPELVLGINIDVTEQVNYEKALQEAKQMADLANKTKSEFVANMSHEIRTPMNAVIGLLHLLDRTELTSKQKDYVKKSDTAARSLLRILNDILDFSKVEAGKLELDPHPFRLSDLIENITPILSANIGDKDVELVVDIDYQLPAFINLDSLRLQQILVNLAGNAIKFTDQGHVKIQLKKLERDGKDWLECSIKDTGIGIKPDQLEKLFEDFTQAETSTVRKFGGTGLGLSISKKLVEMMGGNINVKSELAKGSHFSFAIPIVESSDINQLTTQFDFRHLNVLVVDDHEASREAISNIVLSLGWSVQVATSGSEALKKVQDNEDGFFDLILMDYKMPDMSGWETAKSIRQYTGENSITKILMVTAYGKEIELPEADSGNIIQGVMDKPLGPSELVNYASRLFGGASGKSSARSKTVRLQGVKILLVEDNEINRLVAREMLEAEGAAIDLAEDGFKALDVLETKETVFDLILMDVQMPGIDGYETTRRIRQTDRYKHLPLLP